MAVQLLAGLEGREPLATDLNRHVLEELLAVDPQVEGMQAARPLGVHWQAAEAAVCPVVAHVALCLTVLAAWLLL